MPDAIERLTYVAKKTTRTPFPLSNAFPNEFDISTNWFIAESPRVNPDWFHFAINNYEHTYKRNVPYT
jgi:hypothetical protein